MGFDDSCTPNLLLIHRSPSFHGVNKHACVHTFVSNWSVQSRSPQGFSICCLPQSLSGHLQEVMSSSNLIVEAPSNLDTALSSCNEKSSMRNSAVLFSKSSKVITFFQQGKWCTAPLFMATSLDLGIVRCWLHIAFPSY